MSNRSAFKQNLRSLVAKGGIPKANANNANTIIEKWHSILDCKDEAIKCEWDQIIGSLFDLKTAMKEADVPQTDIDYVQNLVKEIKVVRNKLQDLYVREGSRVDQLESLWGLEAGALDDADATSDD